jgi:tRNA/rRNA methyltransferase
VRAQDAWLNVQAMPYYIYILKCSDGSYYTGSTSDLQRRLAEHQSGIIEGYTSSRRPVELVWSAEVPTKQGAFLRERQIKGWSRAKKEALIRGDWNGIQSIVIEEHRRRSKK